MTRILRLATVVALLVPIWLGAQGQGQAPGPGPGPGPGPRRRQNHHPPAGGSRPGAGAAHLFTQDAYTEYALLEPGSEPFRIRFLPENAAGATELVNATRGGSEGSDVAVFDPRTGKPLNSCTSQANDPEIT